MTFTLHKLGKRPRAWCAECAARHSERNCPARAKERRLHKRRIADMLAYSRMINEPRRGETA